LVDRWQLSIRFPGQTIMPPMVYWIVLNASFSDSVSCPVIGFIAGHKVNVGMTVSLDRKNSPTADW